MAAGARGLSFDRRVAQSGRAQAPLAVKHPADQPISRQLLRAAVVLSCSLIAWGLEPHFDAANLILVFTAGVVYVAASSSRVGAWLAIALSILVFDFVFVPPRWGFQPIDPQDYFTLSVMIGVGLLVTELSLRVRREGEAASRQADRLQLLNTLASALARARDDAQVCAAVEGAMQGRLGVRARMRLHDAPSAAPSPGAVRLSSDGEQFGELVVEPAAPDGAPAPEFVAAIAAQASLALARLSAERRRAQAAVEAEGERLRNTLLSGLSHDFRTPLTTIVGATSSLLEQEDALDPTVRRQLLHSVLREAQRMNVMTAALLDLTRMEEGALRASFQWCPADELIEEVLQPLRPLLAQHRLRTELEGDAPLWCDPDLVERVVANLIENAVRHTPAGGEVVLRFRALEGHYDIEVADSGPGVPAGEEQRIFRKFYRGSPASAGTGSGLGLALCAAIARLHGGSIDVRNEAGAVFRMRVPQPVLERGVLDA